LDVAQATHKMVLHHGSSGHPQRSRRDSRCSPTLVGIRPGRLSSPCTDLLNLP